MKGVYLIHLNVPFGNQRKKVQHYIGFSTDIEERFNEYKEGKGSRLLQLANEAGIDYKIARVWDDADPKFERHLKNQKHAWRLCPICREQIEKLSQHKPLSKILYKKDETLTAVEDNNHLDLTESLKLNVIPKRGMRFIHKFYLDENNNPQEYIVTKIAQGIVYYKPIDSHHSMFCSVEDFPKYVKTIIESKKPKYFELALLGDKYINDDQACKTQENNNNTSNMTENKKHLKPKPRKSLKWNVLGKSPCKVDKTNTATCDPVTLESISDDFYLKPSNDWNEEEIKTWEHYPLDIKSNLETKRRRAFLDKRNKKMHDQIHSNIKEHGLNSHNQEYITTKNSNMKNEDETEMSALPQESIKEETKKPKFKLYTRKRKKIPVGEMERSRALAKILKKNFPNHYFKITTDFHGHTTESTIFWEDDNLTADHIEKVMPDCEKLHGKKKLILKGIPPYHYVSESLFNEHYKENNKPTIKESLSNKVSELLNGTPIETIFEGDYSNFILTPDGDLQINLTPEGKDFIHYNNLLNNPINESFRILVQEHINNDNFSFIDPNRIGIDSGAVLIGYDLNIINESVQGSSRSKIFAYADYQTKSEIEQLMLLETITLKGSGIDIQPDVKLLSEINLKEYQIYNLQDDVNYIIESLRLPIEKNKYAVMLINKITKEVLGLEKGTLDSKDKADVLGYNCAKDLI